MYITQITKLHSNKYTFNVSICGRLEYVEKSKHPNNGFAMLTALPDFFFFAKKTTILSMEGFRRDVKHVTIFPPAQAVLVAGIYKCFVAKRLIKGKFTL